MYLYGYVGYHLQHAGSSLHHAGSFLAAHRLSSCSLWCPVVVCGLGSSAVAAYGLFSCGVWAPEHLVVAACGLNCYTACEILVPRPGIESKSPALQGGILTTGPPGKSLSIWIFKIYVSVLYLCHVLIISFFFKSLNTCSNISLFWR